ncbi:glycerol-3-phosphate dehydrogenase [Flammula alnicola]|nr:glycerol-3-phosphate dehydrogenase [Flammula alnicola]
MIQGPSNWQWAGAFNHNDGVSLVCMLKNTLRFPFPFPRITSLQRPSFSRTSMAFSKPQPESNSKVLIFGAGNFGSCLASHLGDAQHDVYMWAREEYIVKHFNLYHRNPSYLTDHVFPSTITAVGPALPDKAFINEVDVLLFAIPTQFLRSTLRTLRPSLDLDNLPLLIFVNKGIEVGTNALTLEIIADTCGPEIAKVATFISGPSFAKEIVERQPTSVSVASFSEEEANKAANLFHQPHFRCYTGVDPIGIELSGALKNVYAIASGMSDGLGYLNNTRAMIITRGLSEMTCVGTAYGASPLTFLGLAGVGDLFLTCSSSNSRNYTVGYRLGQGEKLDVIMSTLGSVAEGVPTTKGVKKIIEELGINAPIANAVYDVLFNEKDTRLAVRELMELPPSRELELPPTAGGPSRRLLKKLGLDTEQLMEIMHPRF